jgi:molybdopterin/thiamine biosynthesis adenylyltransferase
MSTAAGPSLDLSEGRFSRFEQIRWWKQSVLSQAKVLVVGAGALGNEVLKNLALLGVGNVAVIDMDRIEASNLSRSVLFREANEGQLKSDVAAAAAQGIYPAMNVHALNGNVLADVGLGWFRWADVVVGALDNREARLFTNSACARVGRPWIDGGIDVLTGIVRGFNPPASACYECAMGEADWTLLNQRRSCSLLARRLAASQSTPTTPTTASIIGALQVQEVVKLLHGIDALMGRGLVFDGSLHNSFTANYPINADCPWHEPPAAIESPDALHSGSPLRAAWDIAAAKLGGTPDALDLSREIVSQLTCPACRQSQDVFRPIDGVAVDQIPCPACNAERTPHLLHSIDGGSDLLDRTPAQIGLPAWDVLWARRGADVIGIELAGDRTAALKQGT